MVTLKRVEKEGGSEKNMNDKNTKKAKEKTAKQKAENVVYFKQVTSKRSPFGQTKWENVNHQEWAQGLEHGFELGIQEVAKRMLRCGIDVSFISRITELPKQKVSELKLILTKKEDC